MSFSVMYNILYVLYIVHAQNILILSNIVVFIWVGKAGMVWYGDQRTGVPENGAFWKIGAWFMIFAATS